MSQDKLESWGELIKELNEAKRLKKAGAACFYQRN